MKFISFVIFTKLPNLYNINNKLHLVVISSTLNLIPNNCLIIIHWEKSLPLSLYCFSLTYWLKASLGQPTQPKSEFHSSLCNNSQFVGRLLLFDGHYCHMFVSLHQTALFSIYISTLYASHKICNAFPFSKEHNSFLPRNLTAKPYQKHGANVYIGRNKIHMCTSVWKNIRRSDCRNEVTNCICLNECMRTGMWILFRRYNSLTNVRNEIMKQQNIL